jgi:hypothetical protein
MGGGVQSSSGWCCDHLSHYSGPQGTAIGGSGSDSIWGVCYMDIFDKQQWHCPPGSSRVNLISRDPPRWFAPPTPICRDHLCLSQRALSGLCLGRPVAALCGSALMQHICLYGSSSTPRREGRWERKGEGRLWMHASRYVCCFSLSTSARAGWQRLSTTVNMLLAS